PACQRRDEPRAIRARRQLGTAEPHLGDATAEPHAPRRGGRHARPDLLALLRRPHQVARHRSCQRHRRPARPHARPAARDPGTEHVVPPPTTQLADTPTITVNGAPRPTSNADATVDLRVSTALDVPNELQLRLADDGFELLDGARYEVGTEITV